MTLMHRGSSSFSQFCFPRQNSLSLSFPPLHAPLHQGPQMLVTTAPSHSQCIQEPRISRLLYPRTPAFTYFFTRCIRRRRRRRFLRCHLYIAEMPTKFLSSTHWSLAWYTPSVSVHLQRNSFTFISYFHPSIIHTSGHSFHSFITQSHFTRYYTSPSRYPKSFAALTLDRPCSSFNEWCPAIPFNIIR